ncbi:hypothetical protein [Collimonas silvisoli]|uniref:hypothetical protein n=1 Tax=Collimonas silvisoli TaxID=2825884 RepID=UPI001B8B2683|nr:hypothetical protein [Collimonas silvisoli]
MVIWQTAAAGQTVRHILASRQATGRSATAGMRMLLIQREDTLCYILDQFVSLPKISRHGRSLNIPHAFELFWLGAFFPNFASVFSSLVDQLQFLFDLHASHCWMQFLEIIDLQFVKTSLI